jgi:hypothetical protein
MLSVIHTECHSDRVSLMLSVIKNECRKQAHNAECHYAECRFTECRYDECRGAVSVRPLKKSKTFFFEKWF